MFFALLVLVLVPWGLDASFDAWWRFKGELSSQEAAEELLQNQPKVNRIPISGNLTLAGLDRQQRFRRELEVNQGFIRIDQGPDWALYQKEDIQVLAGYGRPRFLASDVLYSGQLRLDFNRHNLTSTALAHSNLHAYRHHRIAGLPLVFHNSTGGKKSLYGPALHQPRCGDLMKAFAAKDLTAFKKALKPEHAQLRMLTGPTYLAELARQNGTSAYVAALLEIGASPSADENLPLLVARDPETVKLMLDAGVDPNARDSQGETRLFGASYQVTQVLLEGGADPNAASGWGRTPLFEAGSPKIYELLVEHGADPNHKDRNGRTASKPPYPGRSRRR